MKWQMCCSTHSRTCFSSLPRFDQMFANFKIGANCLHSYFQLERITGQELPWSFICFDKLFPQKCRSHVTHPCKLVDKSKSDKNSQNSTKCDLDLTVEVGRIVRVYIIGYRKSLDSKITRHTRGPFHEGSETFSDPESHKNLKPEVCRAVFY